jgi:SAM-dependent methyltransferase
LGSSDAITKTHFTNYDITCLDIDGPGVPDDGSVMKYDGHHIPFEDNYFHTTLVMFVLHHVPHQLELLQEIKRVTRHKIIVIEDIIDESKCVVLATLLTKLHYLFFEQSMDTIQYQHNRDEWLNILGKTGKVHTHPIESSPYYMVSHCLFEIDVNNT